MLQKLRGASMSCLGVLLIIRDGTRVDRWTLDAACCRRERWFRLWRKQGRKVTRCLAIGMTPACSSSSRIRSVISLSV